VRFFFFLNNTGEANAIVLGKDCVEPMTHIASLHEREEAGSRSDSCWR
jgi:hypothetical protein